MINLGFISTAHTHFARFSDQIARMEGVQISHIWDDDPMRGSTNAAAVGANFVDDLEDICATETIDGFVICAPNNQRLSLLRPTIASGKPILCEKPLSLTVAESREIKDLMAQYQNSVSTGYFRLGYGGYLKAREMVRDGALGKITHINNVNKLNGALVKSFYDPAVQWFVDPAVSGGGAMVDLGTHGVNLLSWFMGAAEEVLAISANLSGNYSHIDDYGVIHIRFRNGVLGNVEAGWIAEGGMNTLSVFGHNGSIIGTKDDYLDTDHELRHYTGRYDYKLIEPLANRPMRIDRLIAQIKGEVSDRELAEELDAGWASVSIMEAAQKSIAQGGWCPVEDF